MIRKLLRKLGEGVLYYIIMHVLILVMIPEAAQGPLLKITGLTITLGLLIAIFEMVLGDGGLDFFSTVARRLLFIIIAAYAAIFLCAFIFENFGDLLQTVLNGFR